MSGETKTTESAAIPEGLRVVALALLAAGERERGASEVAAMEAADMRLRQAQAYASGGLPAMIPWVKDHEDLARINDAVGVGRPMGFDDLVKWIGANSGPKVTPERLEKMIHDDRGPKWGAATVSRLKARKLDSSEAVQLANELREQLTDANEAKTKAAREGRARKRANEKKRAERKRNNVGLDRGDRAKGRKNKGAS